MTLDNKKLMYIDADIKNTSFGLGIPPKSISYINISTSFIKEQDDITLPSEVVPIRMLKIEKKSPWELYGSDHNSGLLWFGESNKINEIHKDVEIIYLNYVTNNNFSASKNINDLSLSESPVVKWDFDDGNSLMIAYVDVNYQNLNELTNLKDKNVISYNFGAVMDDRLAHEFLQPYIEKLLRKIKIQNTNIDPEDLGDIDDYEITVNGKSLTSKHNDLLLKLAEHMYCSIPKWHEGEPSDGESTDDELEIERAFAKKIMKNKLINSIQNPLGNTEVKLVYQDLARNSNKEYYIELINKNDVWIVKTKYGKADKEMTEKEVLKTPNIVEAQELYLSLLKEKLIKGYDFEEKINMKNKPRF